MYNLNLPCDLCPDLFFRFPDSTFFLFLDSTFFVWKNSTFFLWKKKVPKSKNQIFPKYLAEFLQLCFAMTQYLIFIWNVAAAGEKNMKLTYKLLFSLVKNAIPEYNCRRFPTNFSLPPKYFGQNASFFFHIFFVESFWIPHFFCGELKIRVMWNSTFFLWKKRSAGSPSRSVHVPVMLHNICTNSSVRRYTEMWSAACSIH